MTDGSAQPFDPERFKRDLVAVIPHLRAFARGLWGRARVALAQMSEGGQGMTPGRADAEGAAGRIMADLAKVVTPG